MHPLPGFIKTQIAKDIGYGLALGLVPGLYFKQVYLKNYIQRREEFYVEYDKTVGK
eukprot:gene5084-6328_t